MPRHAVSPAKMPPLERPAKASAPPARTSAAPRFLIQFGAYAVAANAQSTKKEVEAAGLPAVVTHAPDASGRMLYYVRSQPFVDRGSALAAAAAVKTKARRVAGADPIEYVIVAAPAAH